MKMLAKSRAKSLPSIKLSIEDINHRMEKWNNPLRALYFVDYPNIMMCECLVCNQVFERLRSRLSYNLGCPVCDGRLIIQGFNDFATIRKELVKFFLNPEDAKTVTEHAEINKPMKCPKCGYIRDMLVSNLAKRGFSCPCEQNNMGHLFIGANDIATKEPWMIPYLVDPEDAKKCTSRSKQKILIKCPYCSYKFPKAPADLYENGIACPMCGDGVSYPNKFFRSVLNQLSVDFIPEFSPKWAKGRRYDNYLIHNNNEYIFEIDGGFHSEDTNLKSLKETKEIDNLKEEMAKEHGIKVIRIDAKYSDKQYLQNNILHSVLSSMYDLSSIDWNQCDQTALKSILVEACKEYNKDQLLVSDLADKYHVNSNTMRRYLKRGAKLGLCNISEDSHTRAARIKRNIRN